MLRSVLFTAIMALSLGLTACGKTTQQKVDEANQKVAQLNSISQELANENIYVQVKHGYEDFVDKYSIPAIQGRSDSGLLRVEAKLNQYVTLANEVLATLDDDNIVGDEDTVRRGLKNAKKILAAIGTERAKRARADISDASQANDKKSNGQAPRGSSEEDETSEKSETKEETESQKPETEKIPGSSIKSS